MMRLPLTIEHALLGFLRQHPMHGYEIFQHLSHPDGLGLVWRLKQSQLYSHLGRLEAEGYVAGKLEPQETRPARRVYTLTPSGSESLLSWVTSPVRHGRQIRIEFLAKFYFAQREGPEAVGRLLESQREACRSWLADQRTRAEELQHTQPYDWLVCQFRIGQIEAMLAWLDTCEQSWTMKTASR